MNPSLLENVLWLAGFVGHVCLALVLLLRKRLYGFQVLTFYAIFQALATVVLFLVLKYGTKHAYFVVYWTFGFGADPIVWCLVVQVIRDVFSPLKMWGRNIPTSFLVFLGLSLLTSALFCLGIGPPGAQGFDLWQNRENLFTSLMVCSILVVVSVFALSNGLPGRPHALALTFGLFTWSYSSLMQDLVRSFFGWGRQLPTLEYIREGLYLAVIVYWIVTFWKTEKKRPPLPPHVIAYMTALRNQMEAALADEGIPRR